MADWSQMHYDILSQIFSRITSFSDYIKISSVCSWWHFVAVKSCYTLPQIPALMVVNSSFPNRRQLVEFRENISDHHNICVPLEDRCCGSHKGWLFLIQQGSNSMYLLNPFIKRRVFLPRLDYPFEKDVHKAVLSSSPSAEANCTVLILFRISLVAFCKLADKSWTGLCCNDLFYPVFSDALFFRDQFYAVDEYGRTYTCNLDHPGLKEVFPQRSEGEENLDKWYLVELRGKIHRVQRKSSSSLRFYYNVTNVFEDNWDSYKMDSLVSTWEFRVWKMDPNKKCWIRVKHLGEYALFLGCNNSVAISELEVSGIKGNRIYFTDDRQRTKHFGFMWPGKDMGIFDLGDSSFKPLCWTQCEWSAHPPAVWVTPSL